MAPPVRARVAILTCSVVAIAGIGGWYGADLKMSQEARKETQQNQSASRQEVLAQLEDTRKKLIVVRTDLEKKIAALEMKQRPAAIDAASKLEDQR